MHHHKTYMYMQSALSNHIDLLFIISHGNHIYINIFQQNFDACLFGGHQQKINRMLVRHKANHIQTRYNKRLRHTLYAFTVTYKRTDKIQLTSESYVRTYK